MVEWIVESDQFRITKVDPVLSGLDVQALLYSQHKIGEMIAATRNNKRIGKLKRIYASLEEAINRSL